MLNISPEKLMFILAIALAVLGPERIPQLARSLSRARNEIRKLTSAVEPETLEVIRNPRRVLLDALGEPRRAVAEAISEPQRAITDVVAEPRLALAEAIAAFKFTGSPTATSTAAGDTAVPPADDAPGSGWAPAPDNPALN